MSSAAAAGNTVRAVDRALDIIESLAKAPRGLPLITLSETVGLHKTTTYRLLCSLIDRNYVIKDAETGKYRLTMLLFELGSQILGGFNILAVARPYLEKISDATGEVVHLVARDGADIVYLYKEDPTSNIVQMGSKIGARNPLYCTGVGKSILAGLPDDEIAQIWNATEIVHHTPNTIVTLDEMRAEISLIRKRGYAIDNEENELGVRCVSAAIRDVSGKPFAAISISASADRMDSATISTYAQLILSATDYISGLFGNRSSQLR